MIVVGLAERGDERSRVAVVRHLGQVVELAPHDLAAADGAVQDALVEDAPELGRTRSARNCLAGQPGGYAVQLARQAGATVTATGSARSTDRICSYGADRIVDYTATPLLQAAAGQRFDVVLNLVPTSPEETADRPARRPRPGRRRAAARQDHPDPLNPGKTRHERAAARRH